MTNGTWFDGLTRALAGGDGGRDRRGFLRLLAGGVAGSILGAVLPRESEAAPAAQATCSPRPRVVVTNSPTPTGLSVSVSATGAGNSLQRITFGALRNGVIDVAGVVTGAGSGFSYAVPAGATQTAFTVRATDTNQVVQIPFTVRDGCGDWPTFVGTGAGVLQNPAYVCQSGETILTEAASVGTTTLKVSNQGCFKIGERIGLDPGGPNEEFLEVVGFGSVLTKTAAQKAHPAGTRARRYPGLDPDFCVNDPDCAGQGGKCCKPSTSTGRCCSAAQCCPDGCCTGVYKLCCLGDGSGQSACIESSDPGQCCALGGVCPTGSPAGSQCCNFQDGSGFKCHPPSDFKSSVANCGFCGNDCRSALIGGNVCINGQCFCRSAANVNNPPCEAGIECLSGQCCPPPRACGPTGSRHCCGSSLYCTAGDVCCPNGTVGCGSGCCAQQAVCSINNTCKDCLECVAGDRADVATNTCHCGSGPPCNLAAGQICVNGTCTCALVTSDKPKLCDVTCQSGTRFVTGTTVTANESCAGGADPLCTL
jgi:hypothetical protein